MEKGNRGHVPGVLDLQPFAAELETSHGGGTAKGREMSGCKLCLVSPCLQQIKLVSTTSNPAWFTAEDGEITFAEGRESGQV